MTANLLNSQIAWAIRVPPNRIRTVEEWANCYFVKFIFGSPKFISKKLIKPVLPAKRMIEPPVERIKCQVIARTALRQAYLHGVWAKTDNSRGLLVRELDTKEQYWINNYRCDRFDPGKGDLIVYVAGDFYDIVEPCDLLSVNRGIKLKKRFVEL
jgi:hypothetical protein